MIGNSHRTLKTVMKLTAFFSVLGVFCYPIIIAPMLDSSYYKDVQKVTRKGINQAEIQPGNMKVWSDPFERKI